MNMLVLPCMFYGTLLDLSGPWEITHTLRNRLSRFLIRASHGPMVCSVARVEDTRWEGCGAGYCSVERTAPVACFLYAGKALEVNTRDSLDEPLQHRTEICVINDLGSRLHNGLTR